MSEAPSTPGSPAPAPSSVEFYFDLISPFGYLGSVMIERLAARYGREVEWKPVLLGVTVLNVMGLKPLPKTPLKGPYLRQDAPRLADFLDIPFRFHAHENINSLAGLRAFVHLKEREPGRATELMRRLYAALWTEGRDITKAEVVCEEAEALGCDSAALLDAVHRPETKQRLQAAVEVAISRGVFGVPFFFVDGEPIWGVDRFWMIEHWLQHHTWRRACHAASPADPETVG
jgi:2-hydroxychromene-2-carboxylate isomerase